MEETINTQRINLPGDTVKTALDRLVQDGELTEGARAEVWWFYAYAMDNGWNLEDAGKAVGKDATTVHRMFAGRYGAKYDGLVEAVRKFHALADARGTRRKIGFVESSTWSRVEQVCRHALVMQLPAFIYGKSQIGKTTCLKEFARRNNHGQTKYIEIPAAATLADVQREVASACYISPRLDVNTLKRRILDAIDDKMLLIVDEIHRPFITSGQSSAVRIVEWLRQIYDNTDCGIVFSGTEIFQSELKNGRQSPVLEQFRRRGIFELQLPEVPPRADVTKIAKAFGLPPPEDTAKDIITTMLKQSGLKQYIVFLQMAGNLAAAQRKELSWDHFVQAHDKIKDLSKETAEMEKPSKTMTDAQG